MRNSPCTLVSVLRETFVAVFVAVTCAPATVRPVFLTVPTIVAVVICAARVFEKANSRKVSARARAEQENLTSEVIVALGPDVRQKVGSFTIMRRSVTYMSVVL